MDTVTVGGHCVDAYTVVYPGCATVSNNPSQIILVPIIVAMNCIGRHMIQVRRTSEEVKIGAPPSM